MSARRRILVTLEGREMRVRGHGSMAVCEAVTGRRPAWSRVDRAWCLQAFRLADVVAAGERLGYDVEVEGDLPTPVAVPVVPVVEPAAGAASHNADRPLW